MLIRIKSANYWDLPIMTITQHSKQVIISKYGVTVKEPDEYILNELNNNGIAYVILEKEKVVR